MYINDMGEKIVYDNWGFSPSSEFFDLAQFGITNPNPRYYISYYPIIGTRRCYYVFEYVISGAGYIEMNGEKIRVEAGDFYFYHKNAKLTYYSDPDDPYKKVWVNVRGTLVDSLVDSFGLGMFIHKKNELRGHLPRAPQPSRTSRKLSGARNHAPRREDNLPPDRHGGEREAALRNDDARVLR